MDRILDSKKVNLKKNKKKKHVGLWVTLGIIAVLIATPIALVYGFIFDGNSNAVTKDENFDRESFFLNKAVDSIDNTKQTGRIEFNVNQDSINQFLIIARDSLAEQSPALNKYLTSINLKIDNGKWVFYCDLSLENIFKTRIKLTTSFIRDDENERYIFKIEDLGIGKIDGIYNAATELMNNLLHIDINSIIPSIISGTNLSLEYDDMNNQIIYTDENISKDIINIVGEERTLYTAVLEQYFVDKSLKITFDDLGISGNVNLSSYVVNDNFLTTEKNLNLNFDDVLEKTKNVINNKLIEDTSMNIVNTFSFFANGYKNTDSAFYDTINDLDLSSYGVGNVKEYQGIVPDYGRDYLNNCIEKQLSAEKIINEGFIASVNEDDLNKSLTSGTAIGNAYLVYRKVDADNYKFNYFVINELYGNIIEDHLLLTVGLSVNGYQTYVYMDAKYLNFDETTYQLDFDVSSMYYGEHEVTDEFKEKYYLMLHDALAKNQIVNIDSERKVLSININDTITPELKAIVSANGTPMVKMEGKELKDNGSISFLVNKK